MLGLYIEDIDGGDVEGRGVYELTVGRPAGRELTIRARKSADLMAGEVEDTYVALATPMLARGKDNLAPVRRPAWICLLPAVLGKKPLRAATCGWNDPGMRTLRRWRHRTRVWVPSGDQADRLRLQRRTGQLNAVASIPVCSPQNSIRVSDIRHGLAVFGEGHQISGDAAKKGLKLIGFRVETNQLAPPCRTGGKDFLPVLAENRWAPLIGPEVS